MFGIILYPYFNFYKLLFLPVCKIYVIYSALVPTCILSGKMLKLLFFETLISYEDVLFGFVYKKKKTLYLYNQHYYMIL